MTGRLCLPCRKAANSRQNSLPKPGRTVESTLDHDLGVTSAWLNNNVRVHHRFMDYKKDSVLVSIALAGTSNAVLTRALDVVREACVSAEVKAQELHVVLRKTDGVDIALPVIRGALLALPSALVEVEAEFAETDLVLATGLAFIAIRKPSLSVLITGGLASVEWKSEVRDLRHRFDLIVPELDAFLAGEIVKRLMMRASRVPQ